MADSDRAIRELADVSENRLTWPPHKPRASQRIGSPFKQPHIDREELRIRDELKRWRITKWMLSRNHQRLFAGDPAVAVWWEDPEDKSLRCIACDCYRDMASNAHAIYLTLDALRGVERWGAYTTEEATEGARLALPPPADAAGPPWWEVLGVERDWPLAAIEAVYRTKVEKAHPDRGGSHAEIAALNAARDEARKELGRG